MLVLVLILFAVILAIESVLALFGLGRLLAPHFSIQFDRFMANSDARQWVPFVALPLYSSIAGALIATGATLMLNPATDDSVRTRGGWAIVAGAAVGLIGGLLLMWASRPEVASVAASVSLARHGALSHEIAIIKLSEDLTRLSNALQRKQRWGIRTPLLIFAYIVLAATIFYGTHTHWPPILFWIYGLGWPVVIPLNIFARRRFIYRQIKNLEAWLKEEYAALEKERIAVPPAVSPIGPAISSWLRGSLHGLAAGVVLTIFAYRSWRTNESQARPIRH